ncbi:MAG: homocysteine S-methyltransferase family protein [Candidatus Binatia bacterium]
MQRPFLDALSEEVFLSDGAMGTEIYSRGIPINRCYEDLNLSAPKLVQEIHESYLQAGAQVIQTNTFGANAFRLAPYGLEEKVQEINLRGAKIARQASQGMSYVAGSVGPIGREMVPTGEISGSQVYDAFASQIEALRDGGTDLIIIETFSSLEEAEIAYRAARATSDLPVVVQFSFHLFFGEDRLNRFNGPTPEETIKTIEQWGADVVGANCGTDPRGILECIERMAKVSPMRLSAMPNAGLPEIVEGRILYPASPEYMATFARRLVQVGVSLIGGCCGTTPAMIRAMRNSLKPLIP